MLNMIIEILNKNIQPKLKKVKYINLKEEIHQIAIFLTLEI